MATFFCSRSLPYGATPFNRVPGSVKHTLLSMRRVVDTLFANGEYGTWIDINNLSLLYTTSTGITSVAAVNDPIGRAERKAGTNNALNATTTQRPLLYQWPNDGRYYVHHDQVDDKLTLLSMPAGTYTVAFASFSGVQIYEIGLGSTGTLSIPEVDYTEAVLVNRSLTSAEHAALSAYLNTKTPPIGDTDVLRLSCLSSSVNLGIFESGDSGTTWELGDGQTATGTSCVKTITPPQTVILRATHPEQITSITGLANRSLFGSVSLNKLTGLTRLEIFLNQFVGALVLPDSTALTEINVSYNQFTGTVDLSGKSALTIAFLNNCRFSAFTGTVSIGLSQLTLNDNQLTENAVNSVLSALVAAGRTTAHGVCALHLEGSGNAAPTGQGIIDKATLVSRGWTVFTN